MPSNRRLFLLLATVLLLPGMEVQGQTPGTSERELQAVVQELAEA